ncbi:MAG: 5'/3'-nucleotidase SurE [Longimicrobiales bacterium]
MKILITNDDGYLARGIRVLARAAEQLGEVRVVAPDREQSATSHSLTLHYPLRVRNDEPNVHIVDGTPTDCVVLAMGEILEEKPDIVLSGVNHGPNLGDDVLYSGTVAAAMEATILGIPAIALSYAGREAEHLEAWESRLLELLRQIIGRADFPPDTLININLPPLPPTQSQGVRVTTLGRRAYIDSLTRAMDPSGREYFWIGGGESRWWGAESSDFRAIEEGYVSVTPLHLDLTNYGLIRDLQGWELGW